MSKRLPKTTRGQYEHLLRFIEENKDLLSGKARPSEMHQINNLWRQFAVKINALYLGPVKSAKQWKKIYTEWKTNTRRKSRQVRKLTDLEQRLLRLTAGVNPFAVGNLEGKLIEDNESLCDDIKISTTLVQIPKILNDIDLIDTSCRANGTDKYTYLDDDTRTNNENRKSATTLHDDRHDTNHLESTDDVHRNVQEDRILASFEMASSIKHLSGALMKFTNVCKNYVDVEKVKAEAQLLTAQAQVAKAEAQQTLARIKLLEYMKNVE